LARGLGPSGRLAEKIVPERQRLIGANNEVAGTTNGNRPGFLARKQRGDLIGIGMAGRVLHSPLIDIGRNGLEFYSSIREQCLTAAALRRQD
jgi:hypothetical protein